MSRSASKARWCGLTSQLREVPQPAANRKSRLKQNRQATRELLELVGVVGAEEHVVAEVEAHGDPLLEGDEQPAAHVGRGVVTGANGVLVGLLAAEGPASARRQ